MFLGAEKLTTGIATVLANVQPLIAALLAFWCLKKTLTARMLSGLVIGFAGVVVLAFPDLQFDGGHATGALYVVGAALGTALGNVLLKRRSGSDAIWLPMGLQLLIGGGMLALASLAVGESWTIRWTWTFAGALFAAGAAGCALTRPRNGGTGSKSWRRAVSATRCAIFPTDRARAEETLATGQLALADAFIRAASNSPSATPEAARTLHEMLLPLRLREASPRQEKLVLLVDECSARYPWELLEDRWSDNGRPPAVNAGLVRNLRTTEFRPHPAPAFKTCALVVGNRNLDGWDSFPAAARRTA